MATDPIRAFLSEIQRVSAAVVPDGIVRAIAILFAAWEQDRTVFLFGNGGSASTATHFAADLVQCALSPQCKRLKAVSLCDSIPLTSALVNDRGWENVYREQLQTFACEGDVGIGISVHGGAGQDAAGAWSQNVLRGLRYLRDLGCPTIGFIGFDGGVMKDIVDVPVIVPAASTPIVEGFHVVLHHLIASVLRERIHAASRESADRDAVLPVSCV